MSREGFPGGCNPADVLYKLAHSRGIKAPIFEMISEQGPPHARTFTWTCSFHEGKYHTMAAGRSKKEAKNAVAKALIDQIDLADLPTKTPKGPKAFERNRKRKSDDIENAEGTNGAAVAAGNVGAQSKNKKKRGPGGGGGFQQDFQPFGMGFGPNPMMMGPVPANQRMMRPMRMNKDDYMVMNKHRAIYPVRDELQLILKLAETAEKSLKRISDKFCTVTVKVEGEEEKTVEKKDEAARDIMGVARIGELAKGLLLTGDRAVNLVVMCRQKPTLPFLNKLTAAVTEDLEARPAAEMKGAVVLDKLEVHTFPEEGGFCIVYNKEGCSDPYAVNINLTSTKLRPKEPVPEKKEEVKEEPEKDENGIKKEKEDDAKKPVVEEPEEADPPDMLSRDKCLESLALLRRAKWFSTMAAPLDSCVESVRIFKDLCRRDPVWNVLGDWAVELLVEKAISTANTVLTPSFSVLRVMECVASGVIGPQGPGIKDPCERETVDVFDHLTPQEREDVTKSAQEMVRRIHYRRIHEILGMEKPAPYKGKKSNTPAKDTKTDQPEEKKEEEEKPAA